MNWKRLAALTEDGMKYTQYITNMNSKLREKNIDLMIDKKFPREANSKKQFETFKTVSEIWIKVNSKNFYNLFKVFLMLINLLS